MDTSFETWIIHALETSSLDDVKTFLDEAGFTYTITMPPKNKAYLSKGAFYGEAYGFSDKEALINAYKEYLTFDNLPR